MRVIYYVNPINGRSIVIGDAVVDGCARHGQDVEVISCTEYDGPAADVAIHYGLYRDLKQINEDYRDAGLTVVLIDLGYWGRTEGGKLSGYHKVCVNALHADEYCATHKHGPERFAHFDLEPQPFRRNGGHVLLAGQSGKGAWVYGLAPEEWERQAIDTMMQHTQREIRYRPKPSWKGAQPINGAQWAPAGPRDMLICADTLRECHALVTHHGNTTLDALIAGVPVFCAHGVATPLAERDLTKIESPRYPSEAERDQLLYNAAYTQWTPAEIADGTAWAHLIDEGMVPS